MCRDDVQGRERSGRWTGQGRGPEHPLQRPAPEPAGHTARLTRGDPGAQDTWELPGLLGRHRGRTDSPTPGLRPGSWLRIELRLPWAQLSVSDARSSAAPWPRTCQAGSHQVGRRTLPEQAPCASARIPRLVSPSLSCWAAGPLSSALPEAALG